MGSDDPLHAEPGAVPCTDDALRLFAVADGEADRLGHEYLGTEHLVLAMTRPAADRAGEPVGDPLARLGLDASLVRQTLDGMLTRGHAPAVPGVVRPRTSRTHQALALAAEIARGLGHSRIAPAHLLAGVMRERMGVGAQVLAHHGLTVAAADAHAAGDPPPTA